MAETTYAILAILPVIVWIIYTRLKSWRFNNYSHIPQTHAQSLFLGHLNTIAKFYKQIGDGRRHIDYIVRDMFKASGKSEITLLDLRPVTYPMTVIASHDIAEQISRATKELPWSVPKSPTMTALYTRLIGKYSMISADETERNCCPVIKSANTTRARSGRPSASDSI
ncbi:hypothetical protein P154DRAFT_94828 [Amniculicola lignicola CBS 123094]|uniref:Cytochrome P450 n=1 Tax=Amniculicola lignicola CBS 123094 TaxID=1392246 RepID=A0A6A5WP56_9PLEO|nr:hypothetical protein P154DRAFT_94828 [Amniculicola lignicola CBS 123094]